MTKEQKKFIWCLVLGTLLIMAMGGLYYRVTGDWWCMPTICVGWAICCVPKMCQLWKEMGE